MDVRSVMTANPACCSPQTPVPQVAKMMIDNDCGEIPVIDERGAPLGVITDRDIATRIVAQGRDPNQCTAEEAMSSPVHTVRMDSDVKDACAMMEDAQVRRVPVVDDSGKVTGMFSLADLALSGKTRATAHTVREVSQPRH